MKRFLQKVFSYFILCVALIICLVAIASFFANHTAFTIDQQKNILVIGDSQTECAIDDDIFSRAKNYSTSATPYIYAFAKLKKLIHDNNHIDTVLLSFHYGSLDYSIERRWIFEESFISEKSAVMVPFLNMRELTLFVSSIPFYKAMAKTPMKYLEYAAYMAAGNAEGWRRKNIGAYLALKNNSIGADLEGKVPYSTLNDVDTLSQIQLNYLLNIADYCKEKGIALILINTPKYKYDQYNDYRTFEKYRKEYLTHIPFLDYAAFPLPDSAYADLGHLNEKGASKFSEYLRSQITNDLSKGENEKYSAN